jgi:hypothetical protein
MPNRPALFAVSLFAGLEPADPDPTAFGGTPGDER